MVFISVFTHSSYKNQHFWGSLGASTLPGLALLCVAVSLQQPLSAFGKTRPSPAVLFLKHPLSRPNLVGNQQRSWGSASSSLPESFQTFRNRRG